MDINGEYIKEYRERKKLTQDQMADLLGTQRCTITNWELGKHAISKLSQYKIKNTLKVGVNKK